MQKYVAELFGTFWLVLGGCGSAVLAAAFPDVGIGLLGVSVAFGLTVVTMAYAIGHISGCHLNPAVSIGLWAGGRFPANQLLPYIVAQLIGAIIAGGVIYLVASGKAGFDFTKLDAVGQPLANQTGAYRAAPWDCVQDNVTGLMWEVKTTVAGLRNKYNGYAWYNSTGVNDGGKTGAPAANPACSTGGGCDTEKYVAAVNVAGLCGFNDWRLPRKEALRSIIDYSSARMTIDTSYFPNTVRYRGRYWSASPYAGNAAQAWLFDFTNGAIGYVMHKGNNFYVRSVLE